MRSTKAWHAARPQCKPHQQPSIQRTGPSQLQCDGTQATQNGNLPSPHLPGRSHGQRNRIRRQRKHNGIRPFEPKPESFVAPGLRDEALMIGLLLRKHPVGGEPRWNVPSSQRVLAGRNVSPILISPLIPSHHVGRVQCHQVVLFWGMMKQERKRGPPEREHLLPFR